MDGLNSEIEIRFGSKTPVNFKDSRTGADLQLSSFGSATVVVKDPAKYPTVDDVKRNAPEAATDAFIKAIGDLSGELDAFEIHRSAARLERKTAENLKAYGLEATSVKVLNLSLTPESRDKLKAAMLSNMTDDRPAPAPEPAAPVQPDSNANAAVKLPNFCPNCGAKAQSRFCPHCGTKLG